MKKSTLLSLLVVVLGIPLTLFLGTKLPGRWYYLTSTLIVVETMLPFFFSFESRKPQARELVIIAVMSAIAAASRAAFAFLPNFKPIMAIVMIAGIAFGPQTGFLTGALSALASNFFFGQGPWTPWQMMAYGVGGLVAGLLFFGKKGQRKVLLLAVSGFCVILMVVGPLLDCCTIFTSLTRIRWNAVVFIFVQGFPANLTHAVSTAVTLALLGRPLLDKLHRLKSKYGMMEG